VDALIVNEELKCASSSRASRIRAAKGTILITDRQKRADSDREAKKSGADQHTLQIVAAADF
jgi:hypothetical protein